MDGRNLLQKIIHFSKYAKYLPEEGRRETYEETVHRYLDMLIQTYPYLKEEIINKGKLILDKRVLPSMRAFQFGGKPILRNPSRIYNCAFRNIDNLYAFRETMFLLLGGTGVGYSVQKRHIYNLPAVRFPKHKQRFLIPDTIEGWGDAIHALISSFMEDDVPLPIFDFSEIRPKGTYLVTTGGKAPGPEPLSVCLKNIENVLTAAASEQRRLKSIEVHDILCYIADSVLSGGIRRSAMICLFDSDDTEMLTCKSGEWWKDNPQRARANNSAVLNRTAVTKDEFYSVYDSLVASNAGEPGIYFTNDLDWGTNPCAEIALQSCQFCNLTEINGGKIHSQNDLNIAAEAASFFGTLQAGFTDFHYLSYDWVKVTEEERLIGVGITGVVSGNVMNLNLREGANIVKDTNKKISQIIGINQASRATTIKPSGTTSLLLGVSSGVHAWHSKYFIRRIQLNKNEAIYDYLKNIIPELIQDYIFDSENTAVLEIPISIGDTAVTRDEPNLSLLNRVKRLNTEWVKEGHRKGANANNVSATISVKPDEWEVVGEWMWDNRDSFNGLSLLPYDGGSYQQAPFEEIDESRFIELSQYLEDREIDMRDVVEEQDFTSFTQEVACSGGKCEI